MATASLAGLFHVPVVSFSSTSRLLSDRARFRYFFRTVPSDELQAQAIVDILHFLRWQYVITVASDNEYGRSGVSALKQIIQNGKKNICIVVDELFSRKGETEGLRGMFKKIKQFPKAKVIVLYVEFPDAKYFLDKAKAAGLKDYMFIASDSWAGSLESIKGAGNVIRTVIGLKPPARLITEFNNYFYNKLLANENNHTWTEECKKNTSCDGGLATECYTGIHQNGYVPYIIDAVFAIAHALHNMFHCTESTCPKSWRSTDLKNLAEFIQNVTFWGILNNSIRFQENGGATGLYEIYQLKGKEYKVVGRWNETARPRLAMWNLSSRYGSGLELPTSVCSKECDKGKSENMSIYLSLSLVILFYFWAVSPIIPSTPKCSSRHFIFHGKCECFEESVSIRAIECCLG